MLAEYAAAGPIRDVVPGWDASETPEPDGQLTRVEVAVDNDLRWLANRFPADQWPALERVGVELLTLYSRQQQGSATAPLQQALDGTRFAEAFVHDGQDPGVQIHVDDVPRARAALEALGMRVSSTVDTASWRIVGGFLPVEQTLAAAQAPGVRSILVAPWPVREAQGVAANPWETTSSADQLRRLFGVDGSGIDVGVISDTADRLNGGLSDSTATGDLPPANRLTVLDDGLPLGFTPSDEGRGMAELMYDVGPGFDFWFHSGFVLPSDFAGAYEEFRQAGVDVIVDDISVFIEPVFQDGPIAQAIDDVYLNHDVLVFGSAGNGHRESYQQGWSDSDNDGLHNFSGGDESLLFTLGAGETVSFYLHWSQSWGLGVATNIDLEIWNASRTTKLADSDGLNFGTVSFDSITFTNTGGAANFNLSFRETFGSQADGLTLQMLSFGDPNFAILDDYVEASPGISGNHAAQYTFSIGASRYDTEVVEGFSSYGPATLLFSDSGAPLPSPLVRQKPDFIAADGVDTSFFGSGDLTAPGSRTSLAPRPQRRMPRLLPGFCWSSTAAPAR